MKECRKCGISFKPTKHQIKKYDFLCSPCKNDYRREWAKQRELKGLPVRGKIKDVEKYKAWRKEYMQRPEFKKRMCENQKRYREDPLLRIKHLARWRTRREIESGKIKPLPCEVCGLEKSEAHHDDYEKALEVRWLCRFHHREHHLKQGKYSHKHGNSKPKQKINKLAKGEA